MGDSTCKVTDVEGFTRAQKLAALKAQWGDVVELPPSVSEDDIFDEVSGDKLAEMARVGGLDAWTADMKVFLGRVSDVGESQVACDLIPDLNVKTLAPLWACVFVERGE